ncbi:MAG: methylated-DNA--[protein]-cysteine S-methyltransferase [Caldilineaceae bacterium]|nr:methylated-DNA--[protein]-cysteine S-methyltransferase [Caldilineaceae bacterium]
MTTAEQDYALVAEAIHYLESNYQSQPSLNELATHLHLSPFHLQRLFTRWAGVSPKRFVQYLTVNHAKALLNNAHSVLDATYDSGLSSPGRLHDLMVATEAMTPGEYKEQGAAMTIAYGRHTTPFGDALIAVTNRGICALSFIDEESPERNWQSAVANLQQQWQAATLHEDDSRSAPYAAAIFAQTAPHGSAPLQLLLKGTNFQIKVWEALLRIPAGATWSYADLANAIGQPNAARAVGNAVGANPIGYLIPCHRVIHKSGIVDGYHWGATRKKALLAWEAAKRERMEQAA